MNPNRLIECLKEIDIDHSGEIDGDEIYVLAEWVWCSFNPGKEITSAVQEKQASKILAACDLSGNGGIDLPDFIKYYEKVNPNRYHSKHEPHEYA